MSEERNIEAKLPPQSLDAEKSVLGCLMLDKNSIIKVVDLLLVDDFYKKAHQEIYETIVELFKRNDPIDFLSVSGKLKDKNLLEEIGSNAYLSELVNFVPTSTHVLNYAKIVRRKRILRDLIEASQEINDIGREEDEDVDTLLDRAEQKIFRIAQRSLSQNFVLVKDELSAAFERMDKLSKRRGEVRGVATGFTDLDRKLSGLQKSDLIILASRPSMGKTSLALNIAANVALESKIPVGIFSLEMSNDQLIDRLIASYANVDMAKIRTGMLSSEGEDNDFVRIQHAMGLLSEMPLYVDDAASINVLQMRAMARRLQAERGLGLIIVDYLQLMQPTNPNSSPVQQITEISRSLKILARELNIPVLALSQLHRQAPKRPDRKS
ncbi:MAG: replicative DNA helicase [Candidatus Nealsonbacteria bacterium]|nr:replicative DNA helicase [Candidatus Nealsonbacteria bacterium]